MPMMLNLLLVLLLIGASGTGGYLLARAHFTATIANRVLAYQSRLARAQRDAKHAQKDVERLEAEQTRMAVDLERAQLRVDRYESALFDGYSEQALEQSLAPHPSAEAYVQHVQGDEELDAEIEAQQQVDLEEQRRGAELLARNIA